ncbi:MAG: hypothetical protein EXR64_04905 [Dehalococcoidia bacterium]|nr:hypothetical protein [Dehalococcoidia bacterium]
MTQARSRRLGRVLITGSVIAMLVFLRGARRRPWLLPLGLVVAPLALLGTWAGYTLATMDWDDPADYPPAADAPALSPRVGGSV